MPHLPIRRPRDSGRERTCTGKLASSRLGYIQNDGGTFRDLRLASGESPPPFLAYLSACRTGTNAARKLVDESINLVNACHLAGFTHVIGTLWKVSDQVCVDIAKRVYERLGDEGLTDEAVSRGLHFAIRELRDKAVADHFNSRRGDEEVLNSLENETLREGDSDDSPSNASPSAAGERDIADTTTYASQHFLWAPYVHFGG